MQRGECVAILGQNGSGKSTLVRLLSTLLISDGGSAHVFGIDVADKPRSVQRLVNRVSVEASFFKRMSPIENLSYSARFYGMGPRETRARIPEILALVGFPPERGQRADGGPVARHAAEDRAGAGAADRARAAAAGRAHHRPRPAQQAGGAGLHPQLREHHDSTILLCTHDMAEAEALADRIGILHRGELLCLESADEIRQPLPAPTRSSRRS